MVSVIIPVLNGAQTLPDTLTCLVGPAARGLVREVIVADGGSSDASLTIADAMGARIVKTDPGRGGQLAAGAALAKHEWLLFLHSDTVLDEAFEAEIAAFMNRGDSLRAATFTFALDDYGFGARWLEKLVALRCALFALPYGDQGLLISRRLYDEIGGYGPMPLMEDVDLMRRIGRKRLVFLRARALTSAVRYKKSGYVMRPLRNLAVLLLYFLKVPPRILAKLYG